MQTSLPEATRQTRTGQRAEAILRSCVHCGFCNATCPTYQLLGDELDGPRGRIYLIKDMLEQQQVSELTVTHLDRCLTCRACETTCPSGVAYGELLEIGRDFVESRYRRGWLDRLRRRWLLSNVPDPVRFRRWVRAGRLAWPFLSRRLRAQLPSLKGTTSIIPDQPVKPEQAGRAVLLLDGCVQRVATPEVNDALAALLGHHRVRVLRLPEEGCCGGLALHLGEEGQARSAVRHNLALMQETLGEVDAIISTASGCGVTLKDYARLLGEDDADFALAAMFVDKVRDAGEYLWELQGDWVKRPDTDRIALHVPCTLQHGQRCADFPAQLLKQAGYELVDVAEAGVCCGSAGTYSILQPDLAEQLGARKVAALTANEPQIIATANVGCQGHIGGLAETPVVHWLELLVPGPTGEE